MDAKVKPSRPSPSSDKVTSKAKRVSNDKRVKVKKEGSSSISPAKRKPMIKSDSDSDEEFLPPPKRPAPSVKTEPIVKSEPLSSPVKSFNSISDHDVKPHIKPTTPMKPKTPVRKNSATKAGKKRKKPDEEEEEEYDDKESDDEEFKPTRAKKSTTPKTKKTKKAENVTKKQTPTRASGTKVKKETTTKGTKVKKETGATASPVKGGRGKKKEEEREVWKWWEEEPHPEGVKWVTLEHKGPYFAPPYECLPPSVKFYYDGKPMLLSEKAEEAATFFAKMLDHDYTKKDVFCKNFFADWRKEMTAEEAGKITQFDKCDFKEIHAYFVEKSEARKQMTKEEKKVIKEQNDKITEEYGWAMIDGHKEKIGNFKTEPPGLFRGRGDHPKQGRIKKRVQPEHVVVNIGEDAKVPKPPEGHKWSSVQHDNKVTWLASWSENVQGQIKYVMLNPTSRLKGEKDWAKYEVARRLKDHVEKIREMYTQDCTSKEMKIRQRAVAVYFIDKLALRAGNEKDSDEVADTVGCCSLRVEHIKLHEELDGKKDIVEFDFLGKDSIRYYNRVPVDHQVFKNLKLFVKGKDGGDDLFDRLNTGILNKHLSELMPGLSAKVFRTYNASITLQEQLDDLTQSTDSVAERFLSYNRANRAVAILCNHQRAVPKTFDQQMTNLQGKIEAKEEAILETKKEIKQLKKELKGTTDSKLDKKLDAKKKQLARLEEQHKKLEVQATDKEENKEIALGTSKLNYLDPRISVAWCKKNDVPLEKIYNRSQREKFAWAIDMADETFVF